MGGRHATRPRKVARRGSGELVYAEADLGEHYARCVGALGGGRVTLQLRCGKEVGGKVKGSMYRRVWVNKGDLVIAVERRVDGVAATDISTARFDIIHKYSPEEERLLARYGEIGDWAGDDDEEGDDVIIFRDVDDI